MHVYLLCAIIFLAIKLNKKCTREGEVFEYQEEEGQGQATQGKPYKLVAYLNSIHLFCRLHKGLLNCMFFYIAIALVAIILWAQAPQAYCYRPSR
jgi:hypothetical protein